MGKTHLIPNWMGAVALFAFGVIALYAGLNGILDGWQSHGWPRQPGVVVSSRVRLRCHRSCTKHPEVVYRYSVGGVSYTSSRVSMDRAGWSQFVWFMMPDYKERYTEGHAVHPRVDPGNPQRAVLEPGIGWWAYFPTLQGLVFLVLSALIIRREAGD